MRLDVSDVVQLALSLGRKLNSFGPYRGQSDGEVQQPADATDVDVEISAGTRAMR